MKTTLVNLLARATFLTAAIALAACQRSPMLQSNEFQRKTNEALKSFTARVSNPQKERYTAATQQSRGIRATYGGDIFGLGFTGGWDGFSGVPYQNHYMYANVETDLRRCMALVRAIPRRAENYEIMIATLSRCTTVAISYRNPVFTFAYGEMDTHGQAFWRYHLDAARYGHFGRYDGWYGIYHPRASVGFLDQDLAWGP